MQIIDVPGVGEVEFPDEMGDADIVAAVQRLSGPQTEAAPPQPSASRWSQKIGEGMVPGFNRLSAAVNATLSPVVPRFDPASGWGIDKRGDTWTERYRNELGDAQAQSAEVRSESPYSSTALQLAGGLPTAMLTAGAAPAANVAARAAQGAKIGSSYGAAYGAGDAPADADIGTVVSHTAGGAVLGGALGGGMGALIPSHVPNRALLQTAKANNAEVAASEPATITVQQQAPRLLRRIAAPKPTREAELLMSEGVPLTAGLQNPRSAVGQIETASQSLRATGPLITGQRDAARKATQGAILNKVLPPGMEPRRWTGELDEAMDSIYQGFGKAYESVKGTEIYPAVHRAGKGMPLQTKGKSTGAFDQILADKGVMATDATRRQVRDFLSNELSMLPQRNGSVGRVPINRMLAMRSNIRSQIRTTTRGNASREDFAAAEFLKRAEQAVTEAIESQADEATSASLRAIDAQYRNYKILEDAVSKAGDGTLGFNGRQVSNALRQSMSTGQFARGGGGELRDLARAYTRTFDESMSPPTGARLLTVGPLGEWLTGPMVFQMNRPRAVPQMSVPPRALPPHLSEAEAALAAVLQGKPLPKLLPAYGEEER